MGKGIKANRISAEGFGKTKPVDSKTTEPERAKKKHTEITNKVI